MWAVLNGTIVNAATVAGGCTIGMLVSKKLPDRFQQVILTVLGLITVMLGVDAAVNGLNKTVAVYMPAGPAGKTYGATLALVMVASLVLGALLGTLMRLSDRIEGLGRLVHARFGSGDGHRFAEGYLTASIIFCIGPLTLLGCIKNGTDADPSYLYIKALLDGFCAIALTASLGAGVALSIFTVVGFQGSLALLAYYCGQSLPDLSVQMMNVTGGVILLGNALLILDIKRIPVADLLPGIFLAPVIVWMVELVSPGLLITV